MYVFGKRTNQYAVFGMALVTITIGGLVVGCTNSGLQPWCTGPGWRVCASKTGGHLWIHENGQLRREANARFGGDTPDGHFETQEGIFPMWPSEKGVDEISTTWHNAPMRWATYFGNQAQAVHFSTGFGPGEASHGCIRVDVDEVAQFLWTLENNQKVYGTPGATINIYR